MYNEADLGPLDGGSRQDLELRQRVERALDVDDVRRVRLGMAGTSVCFQVRDRPEASVTVCLDRTPPCVMDGREPAEVLIELTAEQALRLARGLLELQAALIRGEASFAGPVRKYLAVHNVLRSLLIQQETQGPATSAA
jgi:hypothetical protein